MKNLRAKLNVNIGLRGRYKLTVRSAATRAITRETGWMGNIITDTGLNHLHTEGIFNTSVTGGSIGHYLRNFAVGSGSTTPTATDTQLANEIVSTSATSGAAVGTITTTTNSSPRYLSIKHEYEFGEGVAEGNISEVGIGLDNLNLFSRTLVVDGAGDPTTITVLSNELLTVTYELQVMQPTVDFSATVDTYDVTGRIANATNTDYWRYGLIGVCTSTSPQQARAWDGTIGSVTSFPSGSFGNVSSVTRDAYTADSHVTTGNYHWGTGTANFNIQSISVNYGIGWFQFGFSPAIEKDNTKTLTIDFSLSWARA